MSSSALADAFERVRKNVVLVEVHATHLSTGSRGTGTIFACVANEHHGRMPFILTAAHVVKHPERTSAVYRIFRAGQETGERCLSFEHDGTTNDGPRVLWNLDPRVDLGAIIAPASYKDGTSFFLPDEFDGKEMLAGLPMMPRNLLLGEGTRVAWAGYPSAASDVLGEPVLCYYEGVVAHVRNDRDAPVYLLDGHNDCGVSGGPVWRWCEDFNRVELVGVITAYCHSRASLSGFVLAIAVNPFVAMFENVWLRRAGGEPSAPAGP